MVVIILESLAKKAGRNFKLLIKSRNLTQEKAAFILSVDEKTIRRWIKDGIDRISTIEDIAEIFDVDVIETFFK
ncbi:MAG: helix-turn-helix transcriptional regulator [Bacilli bacterium]|nr:helix-turn-helix transcriptional regulator [Bacilli bacterium]